MRVFCDDHVTATEHLPSKGVLQSRILAAAVSAGFTILAFSRYGTAQQEMTGKIRQTRIEMRSSNGLWKSSSVFM
jgi:hypothetical protein